MYTVLSFMLCRNDSGARLYVFSPWFCVSSFRVAWFGSCGDVEEMKRGERWKVEGYFFRPEVPVAVILDVDIKSPMYFWRNLLLLSSLSCSSLTASMRLKISRSDFWRIFACL